MNKKKIKLLIALVVIVGGIGALVYTSMESTVTYYMKPSEILAKVRNDADSVYGERVRVGGIVITKTVKGSAATHKWEFMITDGEEDKIIPIAMSKTNPNNRITVKYKGVVPDTSKEGIIAIADGELGEDGVFVADTVLAKCPSKYEAAQQKKKEMPSKGISFDDETGNYIRTQQIGQILKESGKVDILAYDACLMQMGEVAFEVKDYTEVIVGSEETVPGYGFPYGIFLGVLARNPGMSAEELGSITVDAFKLFYDKVKKSAQLSAIRSSKLDTLGAKLAEFGKLAKDVNDAEALKAARTGVMRYDIIGKDSDPNMVISFFGDLAQYAQLLAANAKGTDAKTASLKEKSAALQDFIKKELVIANKASGKNNAGRELSESTGISVYLPPAEVRVPQEKLEGIFEGKYTEFAFDKATGWHDFVTYLYGVK